MKKLAAFASATVLAVGLAGCGGEDDGSKSAPSRTATTEAVEPVVTLEPTPEPTEDDLPVYQIGETASVKDMDLTIKSAEIVSSIPSTDGSEMTPETEGRQLVLIQSTITNTGTEGMDLTCSMIPSWYQQAFDSNDNELEWFGDMYNYPGNPGCNDQLLNGETADWAFAYEMPKSSDLGYLTFTDTDTYSDVFAIALDPDIQLEFTTN